MNIARSTLKLYVVNVGGSLVFAAGLIYFSQELGAAQMGAFFLFQAVLEMLVVPADFGLRGAVEKRISEGEHPGQILGTAVVLKAALLFVVVAGLLLFQEPIDAYIGAPLTRLLVVAVVLRESGRLMVRVLKGELRVSETAELKFVMKAVWVAAAGALVYLGMDVRGIVYGLLAGFVVMLAWGLWKISVPFGRPTVASAKSLFDYAQFNFVTSVNGYVFSWIDVTLIGLFLTQAHVGAYEVSWRVVTLVTLFSLTLAQTMFPKMSELSSDGATARIEGLLATAIIPSLFLVIPAVFGTALLAEEILVLVFGAEFGIGAAAFTILMVGSVSRGFGVLFGRALNAMDHARLSAMSSVVAMSLNVVLNVVLITQFGLVGAAVATVTAMVVDVLISTHFLSRFISVSVPTRELGWCTLAAVGMAGTVAIARSIVDITTVYELVAVVALGAVVYGTLSLLIRPLRLGVIKRAYASLS